MNYRLRQLKLFRFFIKKLKFLLALGFFVILSLFSNFLLRDAKADNLSYSENFTTSTYKDTTNTTGNWDTSGAGQARLLGQSWVNMAETSEGPENIFSGFVADAALQIKTDSNGISYVVWADSSLGFGEIFLSKWTPGTGWTDMAGNLGYDNVSNNSGNSQSPYLELDSNNNPNIIWADTSSGNYEIYFSKWTPGTGWTSIDEVSAFDNLSNSLATSVLLAYSVVHSHLQLDSANSPYVVWQENFASAYEIYFSKWTPGTGWTKLDGSIGADNLSNSAGGDSIEPNLQLDNSGNPYVLWHEVSEIFFTKATFGGICGLGLTCWTNMAETLITPDNVSTGPGASTHPFLQLDLSGSPVPYVAWQDSSIGAKYETFFSKWTLGTGWTRMNGTTVPNTYDNVSNTGVNAIDPRLHVDTNTFPYTPYLSWLDDSTGKRNVFFSKWTLGTGWTGMDGLAPYDNISSDYFLSATHNDFKIDSTGKPHLAYQFATIAGFEIGFSQWNGTTWTGADGIDRDSNPITFEYDLVSGTMQGIIPSISLDNDVPRIVFTSGANSVAFSKFLVNYNSSSTLQSLNVNSGSDFVTSAKLTATQTLNGQIINYFLSNDGGTTWESASLGNDHAFTSQGTDLRWRTVLTTTNNTLTPVIDDLQLVYQTRKIVCSLTPSSLTAGQTVTINASITFAPTSVWATVENNGTLLTTAPMSGGGGNYSADVLTNANYNGQNDVAVFASDGTQEYTCNPTNGATWQKLSVNEIAWSGRYKLNMVSFKNKLWILGGGAINLPQSDVWSSSDGLNWQLIEDNAPWGLKRSEKGVIVFNNKLWLMGGFKLNANGSALTFQNDVWSSPDGVNWTQETAAANWSPRSAFSLSLYNNKLWLSGGCYHVNGAFSCDDTLNDVWSSPDGINWTQETASAPWTKRAGQKVLVYDDGSPAGEQLWLMGGISYPGATRFNDVWSSSDGINWTQKTAAAGWEARAGFEAVVYNNGSGLKMWLLGGAEASGYHNDVWSSSNGITWTLAKDDVALPAAGVQPSKWTHWSPRVTFQTVVFDNGTGPKLWLAGGWDVMIMRNDVWTSSNGADWTLLNQNYDAEFGPRFDSPMIEYNGKLWLIGGLAKPSGITNDVWSSTDGIHWDCEFGPYTLGTHGIACNNSAPAFAGRFSHKLLVYNDGSGDKLWLIGGCNDISSGYVSCPTVGGRFRDVWSFDGTTWTQKTPTAAWPGRYEPAVAVFANKMWIMGGAHVGRDVWSSSDGITWTASPNAPWVARTGHSAISFNDGSSGKLWVMGGYSGGYKNDVWYSTDPTTGTWVQTTASAPWISRYTFGLLTNDDKMWIFGGNRAGTFTERFSSNEAWWSRDGINWQQATSSAPWIGRDFFSYASFKHQMLLSGGDTLAGTQNDVWASAYDYLHFTVGISSSLPPGINLPVAPNNLSCAAQSSSVIRWNFTDNANNETGFRLRANNSIITEVNLADQTFIDENGLQTNTQYQNRQVTAFNNGGESELSNAASCFTLANKPAKIEVHSVGKDYVNLDIEPIDGNPTYTEYAIKEINSNKYVQADGAFGDNAVWQTVAGWGGEEGIKIIGGTSAPTNSNVNAQLQISLAQNTEYSFAVKARNGDGVETAFADPVVATTGQPIPNLVVNKGVAINIAKSKTHLADNLVAAAQAQSGVVLPIAGDSHLVLILRSFGIFLGLVLLILIILLISGLLAATRHLAKGAKLRTQLKLAWQILISEPAKVFSAFAVKSENGTYGHAYERHKSLHLFTQKNFQRLLGIAVIDLLILSYVVISLNHSGRAQTAPYDQSGQEVQVGDRLSYIIDIENQGTREALFTIVSDTLDDNLSYVAASGKINNNGLETTSGITTSGQTLSFSVGELHGGEKGYVTFTAQVKAGAEGETITNSGLVSGINFVTLATNITSNSVKEAVVPINTNVPPSNTNVPPANTNVPPSNINVPPANTNVPPITPSAGNINVPIPPTPPQTGTLIGSLTQNETLQAITQYFTSPEAKKTSQNIVTPILLGVAALNSLPTVIILTSYLLPYLNLLFVEPLLLFFRKKRKKWGIVYDSLTKLPVGLALVRLYSKIDNKLVQTKVTDRDGRYLMIVTEPGKYYITVTKPGYEYPTRYLGEEKQDTKFVDLYHGEPLEIKSQGAVLTANIPLDPLTKKAVSANEAIRSYLVNNLRLIISYLGIILALIVVLIYPTPITIGSLGFHILMFILFRRLIIPPKPKSWGIVYDDNNKQPLHYALVRILDTKFNKLLETQVTDSRGRYSFLVGKNEYQLLAEKEGYQPREIKPVDLVNKETIVNLDVGLKKAKQA